MSLEEVHKLEAYAIVRILQDFIKSLYNNYMNHSAHDTVTYKQL